MSKNLLFFVSLTVIGLTAYLTLVINSYLPKSVSKVEVETAINQAKHLYQQENQNNRDFANGPCLSDALMPNWVVDIAHSPRQSVDEKWENMCPSYVGGRSKHFVELDLDGNLIRAK